MSNTSLDKGLGCAICEQADEKFIFKTRLRMRLLLNQNLSNYELCHVLLYDEDEKIKLKAWTQLLKQDPSVDDLSYIICHCESKIIKENAWLQLLKQKNIPNRIWRNIGEFETPYKKEALCILWSGYCKHIRRNESCHHILR